MEPIYSAFLMAGMNQLTALSNQIASIKLSCAKGEIDRAVATKLMEDALKLTDAFTEHFPSDARAAISSARDEMVSRCAGLSQNRGSTK